MDSGVFQWLKVDGQDSPLIVSCDDGDWPKDYVVTHCENWVVWVDSILATLSHDVSVETDTVRLGQILRVDLAGVEPGGAQVPEDDEVDPGVVLADGQTMLRIKNPWPSTPPGDVFGTFTISWNNPPDKWLKVGGEDSPWTMPCNGDPDWPANRLVTHSTNWTHGVDSVLATLSHDIAPATDTVRLGQVVKVNIVFDDLETWNGMPRVGNEPNKKWAVATFPTPFEIPVLWRAEVNVPGIHEASIRYRRGNGNLQEPAWVIPRPDLEFTNLISNFSVQLVDGPQALPAAVSWSNGVLTIAGVQQGDHFFVEENTFGANERLAVVKNFTWNDLQRRGGIGQIGFASAATNLHSLVQENIKNKIFFALEPPNEQNTTTQGVQRAQLSQYLNGAYANMEIPSARGIGFFPDDAYHGHVFAIMTPELAEMRSQHLAAFQAAYDQIEFDFLLCALHTTNAQHRMVMRDYNTELIGDIVSMINAMSETEGSYMIYHTYEFLSLSADQQRQYLDPTEQLILDPIDPIRHARVYFPNNAPELFWHLDHDYGGASSHEQPEYFVNRKGEIDVQMISSGPALMVLDALHE